MKTTISPHIVVFSLLIVSALCNRRPKVYTVNLDEEPEKRWNEVVRDHKPYLPYLQEEIDKHFRYPYATVLCWMCEKLALLFPDEYYREMAGIAKESGLEFCHVVGLNILYDVTNFNDFIVATPPMGCSSIITEDSKGRILHGRNLDYMMQGLMKNISILVDFTQNHKVVYSSLTFAFFSGITTGQRPNAFTLSLNARRTGWYILNILTQIYTRFQMPVGFAIRRTLESAKTYDEALKQLTTMHLVAPCYLILAGVKSGQGALITRDRCSAHDVLELDVKSGRFYLVETNFDHWDKDGDGRRTLIEANLKAIGLNRIDKDYMLRVLSTPNITNQWTVTTSVMSAANPQMFHDETWIREFQ